MTNERNKKDGKPEDTGKFAIRVGRIALVKGGGERREAEGEVEEKCEERREDEEAGGESGREEKKAPPPYGILKRQTRKLSCDYQDWITQL